MMTKQKRLTKLCVRKRLNTYAIAIATFSLTAQATTLTINGSGYLKVNGQGSINGNIQTNANGLLFPDESLGCVAVNNLNIDSGAVIQQNLSEIYYRRDVCEHYNQLTVSGDVTLSNATLSINLLAGATTYGSTDTQRYGTTLINNTGANPINGYFNGIRESGAIFVDNSYYMHVTYLGGDGNDVYIWRWDDDNDGVGNRTDAFDNDPTEWIDTDGDSVGDNADALPNDASDSVDSDGDGISDSNDAFPEHPLESVDTDGDGIGDNRDAFPNDPNEHTDSDGDGIGDNAETDKDNDGIDDLADSCPLNTNSSQLDTDGDGVGDVCDIDNDADGLIDISTLAQLYNMRFNLTGTAYSDGYFEHSASCGNGQSVTSCRGYELLNDLDFDENTDGELNDTHNQNQGWLPIGNDAEKFSSTFEGNEYHIKNLVINNTSLGKNVGFFGAITAANIYNVHFSGDLSQVNASASYVGGIAGSSGIVVDIRNVSFEGAISTGDYYKYIGGLFGDAGQAKIYDSVAKVTINGGLEHVGGLAGASNTAFTERNYTVVDITSNGNKVGGLFGSRKNNWVQFNYSEGVIQGSGNDRGGLIGYSSSGVYDSFSTVDVSGDYSIGGLIGYTTNSVRRSYSRGMVIAAHYAGGMVGQFDGSTDENAYWDNETSTVSTSAAGISTSTADLQSPISNSGIYLDWDAAEWNFGNESQYPVLIFNDMVQRDTDNDGIFDQIDDDIDNDAIANAQDEFPYDSSEWLDTDNDGTGNNADTDDDNDGVLDTYDDFPLDDSEQYDPDGDGVGNNTDTDDDNDSLLDNDDNCSSVSNIEQTDSDIDGFGDACDIDIDADGLIEISTLAQLNNIRHNLQGTSYHNGDFGITDGCGDGTTLIACSGYELVNDLDFDEDGDGIENDTYNQGEGWLPIGANAVFKSTFDGNNFNIFNLVINNTSLENNIGLFARASSSKIRNLHVYGRVSAQGSHVGGILGSVAISNEFHNISFIGDVSTANDKDNLGGLIGYASQGNVTSSRFIGNVSGGNNHVGGLVGFKAWGSVNGNYTQGTVSANGDRVGGLVGSSWNGRTDYNYSTSNVSGADYVGGLVGFFSGQSVNYSYSLGQVIGNSYVGNLVGRDSISTTREIYWNTGLATQSDNGEGTGYTTIELQTPIDNSGIYANWGTTYWDYGTDGQYPALIIEGVVHRDSDGDKVFDQLDAFPTDPTEWLDSDGDGVGDNSDDFPHDPSRTIDYDTDGDGVDDSDDAFPNNPLEWLDTDGDGTGNNADTDDDNDNVEDSADEFPLDATESVDTDLDGIGNNADTDDDNDNVEDSVDVFPLDATESVDTDLDGIGNNADADDDNDNVEDSVDVFPLDATESVDTDLDGVGNNADTDDDNDNVEDSVDVFPLDATESDDTDLDGVGNNADTDDDNDDVEDSIDAFPLDPAESLDTDGDGIGNNADADDDNDGVADSADVFPLDATESVDTDGDGIGNNADPDDDNDGILDQDDSDPLNVNDNLAPVFPVLEQVTREATSELTPVTLTTPQVTDNIDLSPRVESNLADSLTVGEHIITWTATDASGNIATADQLVNIVDTTAPVFSDVSILSLHARGRLTEIYDDLNITATDLVDGDVMLEVVGGTLLPSGFHQLQLNATDEAGNLAQVVLDVNILPELRVVSSIQVEAGGTYSAETYLDGEAPNYPVVIGYQLVLNDNIVEEYEAQFERGVVGELVFNTPDYLESADKVQLIISSVSNAFFEGNSTSIVRIIEDNVAPNLRIQLSQNGLNVSIVDTNMGVVTLTAIIEDVNLQDSHDIIWSVINNAFEDADLDNDPATLEFEPSGLSQGVYRVMATATENNTEHLLSSSRTALLVVDSLIDLSVLADSDGDGITDEVEGYGDEDNDGIANFLDIDNNTTRLPSSKDVSPLETESGLALTLGTLAKASAGATSQYASLSIENLAEVAGDNAAETNDDAFEFVTPIFNFIIDGLSTQGESGAVVIPLSSDSELPQGAVYRKYSPVLGWYNFVEDEKNTISSALIDINGNCPPANDSQFMPGLLAGNQCIQLMIEDGGPNDLDGTMNGAIEDPGAVMVEAGNNAPIIELLAQIQVDEETEVTLDASGTTDPDGDTLTYQWTQISGIAVEFNDNNSPMLMFTAPSVAQDEGLTFELTVSDDVESVSADIQVKVLHLNQVPTVVIGQHANSVSSNSQMTLVAQGSDVDGDTLSYQWEQISGVSVTFDDVASANALITLPEVTNDQTIEVQVTVSDGELTSTVTTSFVILSDDVITPPKEKSSGGSMAWLLLFMLIVRLTQLTRVKS